MQICMKLDRQSRNKLRDQIAKRRSESGFKIIHIARAAGIDPGQASRICRGDFRTMSNSVVQICNILEIDVTAHVRHTAQLDGRLVAGLMDLWDGTPEDSARLSVLFTQLAQFRRGRRVSAGLAQHSESGNSTSALRRVRQKSRPRT